MVETSVGESVLEHGGTQTETANESRGFSRRGRALNTPLNPSAPHSELVLNLLLELLERPLVGVFFEGDFYFFSFPVFGDYDVSAVPELFHLFGDLCHMSSIRPTAYIPYGKNDFSVLNKPEYFI